MTLTQCLDIVKKIDEVYLEPVCPRIKRTENGTELYHLRWMIAEMQDPLFTNNKAMRWLGYIQGVLVGVYKVPLNEMKEMSRVGSSDEG